MVMWRNPTGARLAAFFGVAGASLVLLAGCGAGQAAEDDSVSRAAGPAPASSAAAPPGPAAPASSPAAAPVAAGPALGAPGTGVTTAEALLAVRRLWVDDPEDSEKDEPVLGVIGFQMRAGDPDSVTTFMFADNPLNNDCQGRLQEIAEIGQGHYADIPAEYGAHTFTMQPWTIEQATGAVKDGNGKRFGPPVFGMLAIALDGDSSTGCDTWDRVQSFAPQLEEQLKVTVGALTDDNVDDAAERLKATARSLQSGFAATAPAFWQRVFNFGITEYGDQDDHIGSNFSAFMAADEGVADELQDNSRVFSKDERAMVGLLRPRPAKPFQTEWEGVASVAPGAAYRLQNLAEMRWSDAEIRNVDTGNCIDSPGGTDALWTQLTAYSCNKTPAQRIQFGPGGRLELRGRCLDARDGSNSPGTALQLAACSGNKAQSFTFKDGMLKVLGACVAVADPGTSGAPLVLAGCDPASARQKFAPFTI
ncbi:MAG: hypothetical protein RLZ55_381 [Actinomycetota bacterium]|jgi:uncharacterized protein YjbJ (UPF0337 family)